MTDVARVRLGKLLYGGLFTLAWPAALAGWSIALDRSGLVAWPVPVPPAWGAALAAFGLGLVALAMRALIREGGGLPMNAYPTRRRVAGSAYGLLAHPIYAGFTLTVAGVAALGGSPAGFWLAAPLTALAATALVVGYEGPATRARLGAPAHPPLLSLPRPDENPAPARAAIALLSPLLAWACLYAMLAAMPEPADARDLASGVETALPRPAWAVFVYSLAYPYAALAPLALIGRGGAAIRRFSLSAWLLIGAGFALMLLLPGRHPLPDPGDAGFAAGGLTAWLVRANHAADAAWLACPSFHVGWTVLASAGLALRWPRLAAFWWAAALAVASSCLLTGAHALVDVAAGWALALACWRHRALWARCVAAAERIGNGLTFRRIGRLRVLSHAAWSFAAAAAGMLLAGALAGPARLPALLGLTLVGLAGAAAWGQWLEGGGRLSRPFGYFGFLFAASGVLLVVAARDPAEGGALMAAVATAAPLAQAVGRGRCLVQGCCHGRPVASALGIRIRHPESRVSALGGLACVPIHPTPLYSALANLAILAVLLRLWQVGAPGPAIAGGSLILTGLARFSEERFRGEPQTRLHAGLSTYQWLSIGIFLGGLALSALPGAPAAPAGLPGVAAWSHALVAASLAGLVAALAMSVDLPGSALPLSCLTVAQTELGTKKADPPARPRHRRVTEEAYRSGSLTT